MTPIIGGLLEQGLKIVNKFVKDPEKAMEHELKIKELAQAGDIAELNAYMGQLMGQIDINKIEAASSSLFKSGWRPFVGWVCGTAFAYKFIVQPFLIFVVLLWYPDFNVASLPEIQWTELSAVLFGILGLGQMRSKEIQAGAR